MDEPAHEQRPLPAAARDVHAAVHAGVESIVGRERSGPADLAATSGRDDEYVVRHRHEPLGGAAANQRAGILQAQVAAVASPRNSACHSRAGADRTSAAFMPLLDEIEPLKQSALAELKAAAD